MGTGFLLQLKKSDPHLSKNTYWILVSIKKGIFRYNEVVFFW